MKRVFGLVLLCASMASCGNERNACGQTFPTVGLINADEKVPGVHYRGIIGNIVWSVLLVELVFPTVYFVGWSIQEPVAVEDCSKLRPPKGEN